MRIAFLVSLLGFLAAAPVVAQEQVQVIEAEMPLELFREEGQPVEMGPTYLAAGDSWDAPFFLIIHFRDGGNVLGPPWSVTGQIALGDYCRNEDSGVRAVLISDATGQVWSGRRINVRAGPRQNQRWADGFQEEPDLLAALAAGGTVTLALQDDDGLLWNEVKIDILTPEKRAELYAANVEIFRTTDPATVPIDDEPPPEIVARVPGRPAAPTPPPPPRTCPD